MSKSCSTGQKRIYQQASRLLYCQMQLHALADAGIDQSLVSQLLHE